MEAYIIYRTLKINHKKVNIRGKEIASNLFPAYISDNKV